MQYHVIPMEEFFFELWKILQVLEQFVKIDIIMNSGTYQNISIAKQCPLPLPMSLQDLHFHLEIKLLNAIHLYNAYAYISTHIISLIIVFIDKFIQFK